MTITEIQTVVARIASLGRDPEMQHWEEDNLHEEVLRAIAEGADNPSQLAAEALKSCDLEFPRWCA